MPFSSLSFFSFFVSTHPSESHPYFGLYVRPFRCLWTQGTELKRPHWQGPACFKPREHRHLQGPRPTSAHPQCPARKWVPFSICREPIFDALVRKLKHKSGIHRCALGPSKDLIEMYIDPRRFPTGSPLTSCDLQMQKDLLHSSTPTIPSSGTLCSLPSVSLNKLPKVPTLSISHRSKAKKRSSSLEGQTPCHALSPRGWDELELNSGFRALDKP